MRKKRFHSGQKPGGPKRPERPGESRGTFPSGGRPQSKRPVQGQNFRPKWQGDQFGERIKPSLEAMNELLTKAGIELKADQLEQLWKYHNLIRARNDDRELTRIIGFEPMVIKHYIDCMIVGDLFHLPSPLVDVGTGPGFPGIPLKIRYPKLEIILAEPRPKRITFLEEACRMLRFEKVSIFEHKVVSQSFKTPVKGVITRAVEDIDKTMLRTSGALDIGGQLIFMKGPNVDPEIEMVEKRFGDAFSLTLDKSYTLPNTPHERRLVVYTKVAPLPAKKWD